MNIVTHTDLDGVCCAALFIRKFGPSINIIFSTVQQAKDYSDSKLSIDYTCDLPKIGNSKNIDHHKSNYENLKATNRLLKDDIVDPNAFSATDLVYEHLGFENDPISEQIKTLGNLADRALLPDEYESLAIVLSTNEGNHSFLKKLSDLLAKLGKAILNSEWLEKEYRSVMDIHMKSKEKISTFIKEHPKLPRIVIIDTRNIIPGTLAKEVFKPMFDQKVAVIALLYEKSKSEPLRVSFRVNKPEQDVYDVSKIAAFFGGGGHRMASACTPDQIKIPEDLIKQLRTIMKSNDNIGFFSLD